ncbi:MAG: hypothetical protein E6P95_00590 [Candidatus Moraniibacteriota bacterium]|nr:MAG: hypothetical protein E6P95_00590 [Candidatus Moranbacteria bacterium]
MQSLKGLFRFLGITLLSLFLALGLLFGYFNLPGPMPREDIHLGMTFSSRYATDLGLDWRETYLALLHEVGVKKLRLPVYWDLVEREPGTKDYSDIDWQLAEAKQAGAEVILSIGQRVPRWPECHLPYWVKDKTDLERQQFLRKFLQETVNRYKDEQVITTWQVENEPFLVFFGECPPLDVTFLEEEIALVKTLDPTRPVLLTDSGELSIWTRAAKRGDIFGTTMYRMIYKGNWGYVTYPIGPNFFRMKEWLVRFLTKQENFMVIELQAEPWANGWVANVPLAEQFITMNEELLEKNVTYARQVGFQDIYLWGGEWWYWLKTKKDYPAVWEKGKELFRQFP